MAALAQQLEQFVTRGLAAVPAVDPGREALLELLERPVVLKYGRPEDHDSIRRDDFNRRRRATWWPYQITVWPLPEGGWWWLLERRGVRVRASQTLRKKGAYAVAERALERARRAEIRKLKEAR